MGLINNVNELARMYFNQIVNEDSIVVDATCGNGNDACFIAKIAKNGKVYAFDIQKEAFVHARELFANAGVKNVLLINESHHLMKQYVQQPIDLAVFNLGYLPGGDKSISTKAKSTLLALQAAADLLKVGGYISICSYVGHEGAKEEFSVVEEFAKGLSKECFNIIEVTFPNRNKDTSPVYFLIEKFRVSGAMNFPSDIEFFDR